MIEIISIFLHLLVFILFSYFPINGFTFPCFANFKNSDFIVINITNLIFILLIISYTNISLKLSFIIMLFINLILLLFNFKNIFFESLKKKNFITNLFFFLICFIFFINLAQNLQFGYDGLQIWKIKANNFYNGFNYFEASKQYDHVKQYPHLGSFIWAYFWENSLNNKEYIGRFFHIYIYLISIFILISYLKKVSDVIKIFIIILILSFSYDIELNGYQEYLIFSILIFSMISLLNLINSNYKKIETNYFFLIFLINLIIICFIKNEGIIYSIFFSILSLFLLKKNLQKIITLSVICFAIISQIYLTRTVYNIDNTFQFSITDAILFNNQIFQISEILYRFSMIIFYSIHASLKYPIILFNFVTILLAIYYYKQIPENKFLIIFFILNILFIFSIYLITPFPFEWHLQTSIKRLYLQTSGLYLFLIINILNIKKIKI